VIQALVVVAVQLHPGCVVTEIEPDPPAFGAAIRYGAVVKLHGPDSVTVNDFPPIVRVALLETVPVLGATVKATVPDPVPVAPPEMVTHAALLDAVQLQFDDVVTVTVPFPPPFPNA
jgi:hypothetical protein